MKRKIDITQQHHCDQCGNVATHSVTDCKQTEESWYELPARFGCRLHAVVSMAYLRDGREMPTDEAIKVFERTNAHS